MKMLLTILAVATLGACGACAHTHSPDQCVAPPPGYEMPAGWDADDVVCLLLPGGGVTCSPKAVLP